MAALAVATGVTTDPGREPGVDVIKVEQSQIRGVSNRSLLVEAHTRLRDLALPIVTGLLAAACDTFYTISAIAPLKTPIDSACIRQTLAQITGTTIRVHTMRPGDNIRSASYFTSRSGEQTNITQIIYSDSSAVLGTGTVRINQSFGAGADAVGSVRAALLRDVRDRCGGEPAEDARPLVVVADYDPSYEMWVVPGTHEQILLRWTMDSNPRLLGRPVGLGRRLTIEVDTVTAAPHRATMGELPATSLRLAKPPEGFSLATECWRGDSVPPGTVVAFARETNTAFRNEILSAWHVDVETAGILRGRPVGVQCRNASWWSPLPKASSGERRAALTFTPAPGRSRIYMYRPGDGSFSLRNSKYMRIQSLALDGHDIARLSGSTFLMVEVAPGRHAVRAGGDKALPIAVDAAPDSVYYVRALPGRPLEQTTAGDAQGHILAAQLVRSTWGGTPGGHKYP